jgi:hypothetical protein
MATRGCSLYHMCRTTRLILALGGIVLAVGLLTTPGWAHCQWDHDCATGGAGAVSRPVPMRSGRFSAAERVMVSLLNQKIKRINVRLARSHNPQERARLLQRRQELQARLAHVGQIM